MGSPSDASYRSCLHGLLVCDFVLRLSHSHFCILDPSLRLMFFLLLIRLMLVGGLQARFGHWTELDDKRVWSIPSGHGNATRAIIVCSYLFVCSFAITMGPVSWTYPAEIFPMRVRAKAVALSTASNWLWNTIIAVITPYMTNPDRGNMKSNVFWVWGGLCGCASAFLSFFHPRTIDSCCTFSSRLLLLPRS